MYHNPQHTDEDTERSIKCFIKMMFGHDYALMGKRSGIVTDISLADEIDFENGVLVLNLQSSN